MPSARRLLSLALGVLCIPLAWAAVASAAPVSLFVSTLTPEVEAGPDDASTLSLTFTNISDEVFVLTPRVVDQSKCAATLSENQLPSGVITAVEVEIPSDCDRGEKLEVVIDSASKAGPGQTFTLDPKAASDEDPGWSQLLAFPIALLVSLGLTLVIALCWWTPGANASRNLTQPLRYLDATWKFNDNWVTNVSAIGAILTGLFSASTAKAFLGDDAEAQVALGTVGGRWPWPSWRRPRCCCWR